MANPIEGHIVECKQCHATSIVSDGRNVHEALSCGCCTIPHNHGEAANACPGIEAGHPGAQCTSGGTACQYVTPVGQECPGGHCGLGVDDCTVCRPIVIHANAFVVPVIGG